MADPVSIAFGVIGTAAIAVRSAVQLKNLIDSIKNAPESVKNFSADLKAFRTILGSIENIIRDPNFRKIETRALVIGLLDEPLQNCVEIIEQTSRKVNEFTKSSLHKRKWRRIRWIAIRWVSRENDFSVSREQLSAHKMTLEIALMAANIHNNNRHLRDLSLCTRQIQHKINLSRASVRNSSAEESSILRSEYGHALRRWLLKTEPSFQDVSVRDTDATSNRDKTTESVPARTRKLPTPSLLLSPPPSHGDRKSPAPTRQKKLPSTPTCSDEAPSHPYLFSLLSQHEDAQKSKTHEGREKVRVSERRRHRRSRKRSPSRARKEDTQIESSRPIMLDHSKTDFPGFLLSELSMGANPIVSLNEGKDPAKYRSILPDFTAAAQTSLEFMCWLGKGDTSDDESRLHLAQMNLYGHSAGILTVTEEAVLSSHVVAEYTFRSSRPGDLAFDRGDIILTSEREGERLTGKLNNASGEFPHEYVRPCKLETLDPEDKKQALSKLGLNSFVIATVDYPPCLFGSGSPGRLSYRRGDVIRVIEGGEDQSWYQGLLGRKRGQVPVQDVDNCVFYGPSCWRLYDALHGKPLLDQEVSYRLAILSCLDGGFRIVPRLQNSLAEQSLQTIGLLTLVLKSLRHEGDASYSDQISRWSRTILTSVAQISAKNKTPHVRKNWRSKVMTGLLENLDILDAMLSEAQKASASPPPPHPKIVVTSTAQSKDQDGSASPPRSPPPSYAKTKYKSLAELQTPSSSSLSPQEEVHSSPKLPGKDQDISITRDPAPSRIEPKRGKSLAELRTPSPSTSECLQYSEIDDPKLQEYVEAAFRKTVMPEVEKIKKEQLAAQKARADESEARPNKLRQDVEGLTVAAKVDQKHRIPLQARPPAALNVKESRPEDRVKTREAQDPSSTRNQTGVKTARSSRRDATADFLSVDPSAEPLVPVQHSSNSKARGQSVHTTPTTPHLLHDYKVPRSMSVDTPRTKVQQTATNEQQQRRRRRHQRRESSSRGKAMDEGDTTNSQSHGSRRERRGVAPEVNL